MESHSNAAIETLDAASVEVVPHHEWVVTRKQFDSGETGLSTFVPGVAYEDLDF